MSLCSIHVSHTTILNVHQTSIYPNSSTTVRNMDKSGRGYLSNETVYKLMQEQLQMQKSLFQMKKIIAG